MTTKKATTERLQPRNDREQRLVDETLRDAEDIREARRASDARAVSISPHYTAEQKAAILNTPTTAPDPTQPYRSPEDFGAYLARVVTHEQTPRTLQSALLSIIVNIISNNSSYSWTDDEESLTFLLPRYLFHMNERYAEGIIHAIGELIDDQLPRSVNDEIRKGGAR
jgi:hypothetical protein